MSIEALEYCARAVIRHLNGNMDLFKTYARKAMKICEQEKYIATVGEMIPEQTRKKLYELVS